MHVFSRTATMRGNPRDVSAFAKDICELANERSPFDVSLWRALFGVPAGTYFFTAIVESRATFVAGQVQLLADDDYLALYDRGEEFFVEPPQDRFVTVLHSAGAELQRAGPGAAASLATAQLEVGRAAEAIGWSIELADHIAQSSGVPVHVGTAAHGPFGELHWISTVPDIAEVDRVEDLLNKDEDYLALLGRAGELFVPGSGQRMLAIRIA